MNLIRRPSPFVLLSSGHGTLIVNRNDYKMTGENQGYGVGYQLFNTSLYDPEEVEMVLNLLSARKKIYGDGVIALDCGANIGVHSVEWAKHMHGWGEVLAIEAQERIYYALAGNIAMNNCFNVKVVHAAVGSESGLMRVPCPDYCQVSSFGSLELLYSENNEYIGQKIDYEEPGLMTIPMVAIDSFCLSRLDFMKIDVEGMELEVLKGAINTIKTHKPQIFTEWIKSGKEALVEFLERHGYVVFLVGCNLLAVHGRDPGLEVLQKCFADSGTCAEGRELAALF